MKSWQSILQEQIYNDEEFTLDDDNDGYIVSGVMKSYENDGTYLEYLQTKDILDSAYKAGYKLNKKDNNGNIIYIVSKTYKQGTIIFEFLNDANGSLLKCYVVLGNKSNSFNKASKVMEKFPLIYKNFDFSGSLENIDINVQYSDDLMNDKHTFIKFGKKSDYVVFFKFMYLFMVEIINKQNVSAVNESVKYKNEKVEVLIDQFKTMIDKLKTKYEIKLELNDNLDETSKTYTIKINWVDGYANSDSEIVDKLIKIISILESESKKLGMEYDVITVKSIGKFIKTITIKDI